MAEVVALPNTDERVGRVELREGFCGQAVVAPVVRHLEYLHRVEPLATRGAVEGFPLGISTQHRIEPSTLDSEDHARVIGPELGDALGRGPYHRDQCATHPPRVTRTQATGPSVPGRPAGGWVEPSEVLLVDRRIAGPPNLRDLPERTCASGVVIMRMREHESVDTPDTVPGERAVERYVVRARVHEHRASTVSQKDRVSLPHIEHGQRCADRPRRAECGQHRDDHHDGYDRRRDPP